ncbi:MAG: ABC transporter ATP-binding protein/permease [Bacilli bacterium]|nr:ABC transporter ATP-binding protein/permease [Bacilli bacterium]
MEFIKIEHLSKTYKVGKKRVKVLDDINLDLPQAGLVAILGKSGSGKSTLLNIIGSIDKQTSGTISYKFKNKVKKPLRYTAFIFQHYHLLENETGLFNIMLPFLIRGERYENAENNAVKLLKYFDMSEDIARRKVKLLSGGEKERIAILRSVITDPRLLLADEPTGALDQGNSLKTMELLKKASKRRLVLMVTHNEKLARDYADRVIRISDGKIEEDTTYSEIKDEIFYQRDNDKHKNGWDSRIITSNFLRRIRRNVVSTVGLSISLVFCYVLFGFSARSNEAIKEVSERHLDYGTSVIQKEISNLTNSSVSLIKTMCPNEEEIDDIKSKFSSFEIMPNFDAIFCTGNFSKKERIEENLRQSFVYSFEENCFDKSLLIASDIPANYSWNSVIINKKAQELIGNESLYYAISYEKEFEDSVVEYFELDEKLEIIGVTDEFDFLATPKVYFDYKKIDEIFEEKILENLSEKRGEKISWKFVVNSMENDDVSSYSKRIFLRDFKDKKDIEKLNNYLSHEIKLENDALSILEALSSLTTAASIGLDIFLVISLVGSFLIIVIFAYSSYVDDKMESSILSCLGANSLEVVNIFASESLTVAFLAFLLSTVSSFFLQNPINLILEKVVHIPRLIDIPYSNFAGIKGLLPMAIFCSTILLTYLFTAIPILINKKISLRKELVDL